MYKVLLVEDDNVISSIISSNLEKWGYCVKTIDDFSMVLEDFKSFEPHIVLMDITLPFYSGYFWCQEIRKLSNCPIIFVSSANDNMNLIMAVNMGGDDFIAKPFEMPVLLAKIQAMLRRSYNFASALNIVEYKGLTLNLGNNTVAYNSQTIELTKNEFRILQLLFEHKENTVSREDIMKRLWDNECFIDDNTLTVNITRLRKKLSDYGLENFIKTKKGIGYQI